jgi:hypothetical protein
MILSITTYFTNKDLPDIIISPNAKVIAVRNESGLLTFSNVEEEAFIAGLMAKINCQEELLTFEDNDFITCNKKSCSYKQGATEINLSELEAKPRYQQIYITK